MLCTVNERFEKAKSRHRGKASRWQVSEKKLKEELAAAVYVAKVEKEAPFKVKIMETSTARQSTFEGWLLECTDDLCHCGECRWL